MKPIEDANLSSRAMQRLKDVPKSLWIISASLRIGFCLLGLTDPQKFLRSDSASFLELSYNLYKKWSFVSVYNDVLSANTFRTPGYPLFLSIFQLTHSSLFTIAIVQSLLGVAVVALMWTWLKDNFGLRAAYWGAMVVAVDPVILFHTPLILSETLYTLLLVIAMILTWECLERKDHRKRYFLSGLLWAAAAFVKPVGLYLPMLFLLFVRRWKWSVLLFVIASYVPPALWMSRNHAKTGVATFSSIEGVTWLRYIAAGVESLRTANPASILDGKLRAKVDREHLDGYPNEAQQMQAWGNEGKAIVKAQPFRLVVFSALGAIKTLSGGGFEMLLEWLGINPYIIGDFDFKPGVSGAGTLGLLKRFPLLIPLQLAYWIFLLALYAGFAWGMIKLCLQKNIMMAAFLSMGFFYFLAMASTQGYYRYRIPCMPFLAAGLSAAIAPKKR